MDNLGISGACFFIDLGSNNRTEESIPVNAIGRKLKNQNNYIVYYSFLLNVWNGANNDHFGQLVSVQSC